jgi:predicted transcriptional regulator of viral defense system
MPGLNFKKLYEIGEDNYGFVTMEDARRAGILPQRVIEMAHRGTLHREGRALYRLDPFPAHPLDSYRKATLWPYPVEGVLGYETALDLYELGDVNPAKVHVVVPRDFRVRRRTVPAQYVLHHEDLDERDVTRYEGLPVVTAAKAIRQCDQAHLRRDLLRQALEEARQRGLLTRSAYSDLMRELRFDVAVAPTR